MKLSVKYQLINFFFPFFIWYVHNAHQLLRNLLSEKFHDCMVSVFRKNEDFSQQRSFIIQVTNFVLLGVALKCKSQ